MTSYKSRITRRKFNFYPKIRQISLKYDTLLRNEIISKLKYIDDMEMIGECVVSNLNLCTIPSAVLDLYLHYFEYARIQDTRLKSK